MADKKYTKLPVVNQTTTIKNFFDTTVEQLFSKANIENISAYVGSKDFTVFDSTDTYKVEHNPTRDKYSLEPVTNNINQLTGESENAMFYQDFLNVLKSYGVDTQNQNTLFDSNFYSFLPPINIDKFINYQEYFWSPTGPTAKIISGTTAKPINIEKDILGKTTYTSPDGTVFRNGMVISFSGNYVIPEPYMNDTRWVVEGLGESIILINKEQNFATTFSTEDYILYDRTIIDTATDTLVNTNNNPDDTRFKSGGLQGISNYVDIDNFSYSTMSQVDSTTGRPLWDGYVTAIGQQLQYVVGGVGAYDTGPFDSDNTQEVNDYIIMERGAEDNNVWSRINFWYHRQNFLDAGDQLPKKGKRAIRPIIEFDRNIELFNFGTKGVDAIEIAAFDNLKSEVVGRPNGGVVDGVTLEVGNRIIFPNEATDIASKIYTIGSDGASPSNATLTAESYVANIGDVVSIKFGARKQGVEYFWNGTKWIEGQQKRKVNTPILFNAYDYKGIALSSDSVYPKSDFAGTKIFSYKEADASKTKDAVLNFPLTYDNFNNFSEIVFDNNLETDLHSYIAFGGTEKTYMHGYIYYSKSLPNGDVIKDTSWKAQPKKTNQKVEDRYIVNDEDVKNSRTQWEITAKPEVDESSIRVFINGVRNKTFSYNPTHIAITFGTFTLSKNDIIDVKTKTTTGFIKDAKRTGRYDLPLSWHSNLNNIDITTVAQPQYLEQFYNLIRNQEDITGEPLGTSNFTDIKVDTSYADKLVQTDDDLQMASWLFSNDKFNLKDSLDFNSNEYVKYKNRLKKEIKNYVDTNDTSNQSYGDSLEHVLEAVIGYNQGKNVFDYSYMAAFGDKYNEQKVIVNNILTKATTLSKYCDLSKIENSLYVYDTGSDGIEKLLDAEQDYTVTSTTTANTVNFTDTYTLTLGNTLKFRIYDKDRESCQTPPTPSAMGLYPAYKPEIITDTSFKEPITVIVGHDGSKTVAANDIHDHILLEFEKRIWNGITDTFRNKDSQYDLNIHSVRPGRFRTDTGLSRTSYYNLLRSNFNQFINRNDVDFVINEYYDASNYFTWNYNSGTASPGYWRGIFEACYDTERPHTHPWEMLGFVKKPSWWDTQYITTTYTDYGLNNKPMWNDLEDGIIRHGERENLTNNKYTKNNPYRRIGLKLELPVDASANLIAPANIISTTATNKTISWVETTTGTATANATSFIETMDGLSVAELNSGTILNITANGLLNHDTGTFPTADNTNFIDDKESKYTITTNTSDSTAGDFASATSTGSTAVGVAVNGAQIFNASTGNAHSLSNSFTYAHLYRNDVSMDSAGGFVKTDNIYGYAQPSPQTVGLNSWATDSHSPIVGWAFDGLPIYGPYGYTDRLDNTSDIKRLVSSYSLKTAGRTTVGGTPTGEFVEDFEYSSATGDLDEFNTRYGITPEFPSGTRYYVATLDSNLQPAYPFTVGPKYFFTPASQSTNATGTATHQSGTQNYKLTSTHTITYSADTSLAGKNWKFGDGAPVENAWKISEAYPFAIAEALLLTKPGKFASVFAEPGKIIRGSANTNQLLDKTTYKRYKVKNATVHGSVDANSVLQTNTGFTQFIDTYLRFQGLNPVAEFSKPFKTVNSKLGHKFAGFVDRDTMTVFSDNYSTTGNSSSLILPQEDIQVDVHVGPYSSTNDYTGVLIQLTSTNKYKVFGYNSTKKYFEIEPSDTAKEKTQIKVGGEPLSPATYDRAVQYNEGEIIKSGYNYFRAKTSAQAGSVVTNTEIWQRLKTLPTVGGAEATLFLRGTSKVERVEYGTEFDTVAEVFDFLVSLGRHQEAQGYDFGDYNDDIADVNDWIYSGRQFLFWSIGKWSSGNTLNLSPMASGIKFIAPIGKVSEIKDIDQGQFSLLDEEGKKISPIECEIIRDGQQITVSPPIGKELYGSLLYTNEIEHSLLISNKTIFGDTIYNDVLNQRQARLKIKAKRTKAWDGTLSAEGYIIQGSELLPNFDTLASDMGKYNEIGHVPVQKQLYEASRRQYGYQERKYLREFELTQDDQYDFYMGMIRSKGTQNALKILLNSDKVLVPGSVNVYDEWALKFGEFGDVDNKQSLDIKINESEITDERQLIQIAYPEDIVSKVKEVEVLDRTTKFFQKPFLEIEPPPAEIPGSFSYGGGTTARATVNIGQDGKITTVDVTEPGYGYTINPAVTVIAAQLLTANISTAYQQPFATSNSYISNTGDLTSIANFTITDHHANASHQTTTIDLSTVASGSATNAQMVANVVSAINTTMANVPLDPTITADIGVVSGNSLISATSQRVANATTENFVITLRGADFTLAGSGLANLDIEAKRYQPRQRFSFESANSTTYSDVTATVDTVATTGNVVGAAGSHNWEFDSGSRTTITNTSLVESGNTSFTFAPLSRNDELTNAGNVATDNLTIINGTYPHLDVYIDGVKLAERVVNPLYTVTSISGDTTNSYINFANVQALPSGNISAGSTIIVDERSSIDFVDAYQKDLPGSTLNIKVEASDALAAKLTQMRTFDITPDSKSDSTLLIDVDDPTRLVVRPRDMSEKGLWPTTTKADHTGILDLDYEPLPNAGYVSKYNVDYQAFDILNFESLFDRTSRLASEIPAQDNIVHMARSEHGEFDVYKLSTVNANVSYVQNNEQTGSLKYFTDYQLSTNIADGNDLSNVDANYDQTAFYDFVLVLKGDGTLSPRDANLRYANGEKIYDTTIPDTSSEVVVWENENRLYDETITIGNISYNHPKLVEIAKIQPVLSGNITNITYDSYANVSIPAEARLVSTTIPMDVNRTVEADTRPYSYQGTPAFKIRNGDIDGVRVNDYLRFFDSGTSNLHANVFQVASINPRFKEVTLYANSTVLNGIASTIPKADLSFANFDSDSHDGNANASFSVQVYSQNHGYESGDKLVFSGDQFGYAAGHTYTVNANVTPNTYFVSGTNSANTALNVLDDTVTSSLVSDVVTISYENGDSVAGANVIPNAYVKITDADSGNMNGNVYQISNLRSDTVRSSENDNITYTKTVVHADTVASAITSSYTIKLASGKTVRLNAGLGVSATGVDPQLVKVSNVKYNRPKTIKVVTEAVASSVTVNLSTSTDGLEVGMVITSSYGVASVHGRKIASVVDENTITLEGAAVTLPEGTIIKFTQFAEENRVTEVTVSAPVTLASGAEIEFIQEDQNYDLSPTALKRVTSFDIPKGDITANSNAISFVVQDATSFTTDATSITTLSQQQLIKLHNTGKYDGLHVVRDYNTGNKTFKIPGAYTGVLTITDTASSTLTDSNELLLTTGNTGISAGMIVTGGNIATKITTIDATADPSAKIYKLAANIAVTSGTTLTFTEELYANATFVSDRIELTTTINHSYSIDTGTDLDTIIGHGVKVYNYDPEYYNDVFQVKSIPTANTIIVEGHAIGHPYTTGGETYVSKDQFELYGTNANKLTPSANITRQQGNTLVEEERVSFIVDSSQGNITINGANVVTNAFPYLNVDEYRDEIERQILTKAGASYTKPDGSIILGFPLATKEDMMELPSAWSPQKGSSAVNEDPAFYEKLAKRLDGFYEPPRNTEANLRDATLIPGTEPTPATRFYLNKADVGLEVGETTSSPSGKKGTGSSDNGSTSTPGTFPTASKDVKPVKVAPQGSFPPLGSHTANPYRGLPVATNMLPIKEAVDMVLTQIPLTPVCPSPPPPPPAPPAKPDVFFVSDFVTYSLGTGVTETKSYQFTTYNGDDYTIKVLFNHYSAQDRLEVFQSKVAGQRGSLVASTRNFTAMTAQEKTEFNQQGGNNATKDATVGDMGDGFVFDLGKFSWVYNADNGQYITTVLSKHPSRSIAYQYSMVYPVDQTMIGTQTSQGLQVGANCTASNPGSVAAPNTPAIPVIANPNFNYSIGGGYGSGFSGGFGGGYVGGAGYTNHNYHPVNYVHHTTIGQPTFALAPTYRPPLTPAGNNNPNAVGSGAGTCQQFITLIPTAKDNGKWAPVSPPVQIPICPVKPRVLICGDPSSGVGKGDTFQINGHTISLSGATDLKIVKDEILSQVPGVTVVMTTVNNETCIKITNIINSAMIIRNGCAGGMYREVLDYAVQRDQQNCFTPSSELDETVSIATAVSNTGFTVANPGHVQTIKAIPKYEVKSADENRTAGNTSSQCESKGQGYQEGDRLRLIGGVPVPESEVSEAKVLGIRIVNPGTGYTQGQVEFIINNNDATSQPFEYDSSYIGVDDNGGLRGVNVALKDENGMGPLQYPKGSIIPGPVPGAGIIPILNNKSGSYSRRSTPTITIRGAGTGATVVPIMDFGKDSQMVERQAKFIVTKVDDQGAIVDMVVIDRGIYQQFPSDLDAGVPLEYDIDQFGQKETIGGISIGMPKSNLGVGGYTRGNGKGARVFVTARAIPDCSGKGGALQAFDLEEGKVKNPTTEEHFAELINDFAPYGPDGFPMWSAGIEMGDDGRPGLVIDGNGIGGIEFGDSQNPGLLDLFGISPGQYNTDKPVVPKISDAGNGGGYSPGFGVDGTGGDRYGAGGGVNGDGRGIRFEVDIDGDGIGDFNIHMSNANLTNILNGAVWEYDLRSLLNEPVIINNADDKKVKALALSSLRYSTPPANIASMANAWVDKYDTNGWAYLESNTVVRHQEKMVDTKFLTDVFTYDNESAEKEFDIDIYDPFKGILPGFIQKELDFISDLDPVVYEESKAEWGSKQIGRRWWNTRSVRYEWYEQGKGTYATNGYNNQERSINWGSMIPGSVINIYEWIESLSAPSLYDGDGYMVTNEYTTESRANPKTGKVETLYYYWVGGLTSVNDTARANAGKSRSIADLERLIVNPDSQRIPYIGLISPDAMVVNTLGSLIKTEDSIVSVNFERKKTEASEKHTSWGLAGEGDTDVTIPDNLSIKLIDSIAGYNAIDEIVPAKGLSESERFGSKFRPRQTMFKDIKKARKQMQEALNEIFAELKMDTTFLEWRKNLPASTPHLTTINWYELLRTDATTNKVLYYNDDYKPLRKVADTKQFQLLKNVLDKSIIQVQKTDSSKFSLYEYSKKTDTFKLIAMENETVEFPDTVWKDGQTLTFGKELRAIIYALYKYVFINTYSVYWNKFFFKMLKHAYAEQGELDWAFKTTYLKIVKKETDLVPFKGFKVDNFDKALSYFNEVKPYSSKIRNYSDIKQAPIENLTGTSTDFDRPPFYDESTKTVRVLDDTVPADVLIRDTDSEYAGFISSNSAIRQANTQIVFDRVKSDMFKNSSGGKVQQLIADGTGQQFSFDINVEDINRLQVFVNNKLIPVTSQGNGTTVTNYTVDTVNSFLTFANVAAVLNSAVGTLEDGDKIDLKYFDGYDPTLETLTTSIAVNIVNIEANSNTNIANVRSPNWSAAERIWKFNPDVRSNITTVVDTIYGTGASANANIMQNVSIITSLIENGNLKVVTDLVKSKVHATFQGETLDAQRFTDEVPGEHSTYFYTDTRGFDTYAWDSGLYDREVEVDNYIGIFSESASGNVNYRVNDETVYGFDGVTFNKSSYGPDRPEELAVVQPLETLIIDVTTQGNTNISDASTDTRYIMFADLFGSTEYYRRNVEALTTLRSNLNVWDNEVLVTNASALPEATSISRAAIWINGERIEYEVRDNVNNVLRGIHRGTKGTTPNTLIISGEGIYNGQETENIRLRAGDGTLTRDPEDYNWIKPVEIYNNQIPLDENWDLSGSLTAYTLTYDNLSSGANVRLQGYDASWDEAGAIPTEFADGTILRHDVDVATGWDSGEQGLKDAISLTDKGTVLQANTSIIDFMQNFD